MTAASGPQATVTSVVAYGPRNLRVAHTPAQELGAADARIVLAVGGICGSDLHYFREGAVGDFTIREPLILGHEVVGTVTGVGPAVEKLAVGTRVAINPASPCEQCSLCRAGTANLCQSVRFLGSAARMPHIQGAFREQLVVSAEQCVPLPDTLSWREAVFAEPLAVAIHAAGRAGSLLGRSVLITGAGPIGALITLVARQAGAASVTVTDVTDTPLQIARAVGATATVNVGSHQPADDSADIAFEASGARQALETCLSALRPGGKLILIGLSPGVVPVPGNRIVTREIDVLGSFRFRATEFRQAVSSLAAGLDVSPLLSGRFPLDHALDAFESASREEAIKVQLVFAES